MKKQAEHTDKGVTYQHFSINCFANTGQKYDHPKHACLRLKVTIKKATPCIRFNNCSQAGLIR